MTDGICWSADETARIRRSFRISRRDQIWRSTHARHDTTGRLHLDSRTHESELAAWRRIVSSIIACSVEDYDAAESAFLVAFRRYRDGVVGFRPRSPALRSVAQHANAGVFIVATAYAMTWNSLKCTTPAEVVTEASVPQWLIWSINELEGRDALQAPPLDYWLIRHTG